MLNVVAAEDLIIQGKRSSNSLAAMLWWCKCINVITHPGLSSQFGGQKA